MEMGKKWTLNQCFHEIAYKIKNKIKFITDLQTQIFGNVSGNSELICLGLIPAVLY